MWGFQKDGHRLNLCLGKGTKRDGVQVEPTEGHPTSGSDITIPFWQQDLRDDHLAYQHAPFPHSECVENVSTLEGCLRGQAGAALGEVSRDRVCRRHINHSENWWVNLHWAITPKILLSLIKVGCMGIPP